VIPFWIKRRFRSKPIPRENTPYDLEVIDYVKKLAYSTGDDDIEESMDRLYWRVANGFTRDERYCGPAEGYEEFRKKLRYPYSNL
jgi:hypothetical protein